LKERIFSSKRHRCSTVKAAKLDVDQQMGEKMERGSTETEEEVKSIRVPVWEFNLHQN